MRHDRIVNIRELSPVDLRPLFPAERGDLVTLLAALTPADWDCFSAAPGWTVKALALHLLDDDLGWLSRHRDADSTGLLDEGDHDSFVRALAAKNQRWIDGTQTLSPRVVTDLLTWSGAQVDAYYLSNAADR